MQKSGDRQLIRILLVAFLLLRFPAELPGREAKPVPRGSTAKEKELGKESAKDIESKLKVLDDKETVDKLSAMVKEISAISERPEIAYQVKIIDQDVPNAFTLPGGYIYVTKKLLDYVESDHELAGILAHEIAHNTKLHALESLAKAKKLQLAQLLALGVGIAAGGSSGMNIAVFAQFLTVAVMNGYGVDAEEEADIAAIHYLAKTQYNPVGLLTFLERLARDESRRPEGPDPGIFRTHPPTRKRIEDAEAEIRSLGLPVNRGAVIETPAVTVDAVPDTNDAEVQVRTKKVVLFHLTAGPVQSARERGEESARVFSNMVGPDLKMYEVQIRKVGENPVLYLRTQRLVEALPSDAKRAGKSQAELADEWQAAVKNALWEQRINDIY
ncbi:MAG: hypothetical protein AUJ92_04070 [Armatimonadetes bacterium CG2_30_59_28]|nr:M48 family metalloprotease [Armatimonadota bacterium]OIO97209.1 MAG: hypothetical protein AUJ92_04070 [Armatimonadetes bacterium CG2_30_59_28]PIU62905.1 MAG: hypothetical protein COS85_17205 [Armatimonadetes bacterium CG07_land_8_20_14_0_80_59_28]PIX39978.1 MAG: hypothetical protein COZ56_15945 [Armatimonadetes bacterium CG_4_8_14_3_um_filter_58_9]PJB71877.1 MAG: hypothetical protein CO095_07610 [Armatimonadetes bacterium CG_4_9_14_3_um_filter_58_7]